MALGFQWCSRCRLIATHSVSSTVDFMMLWLEHFQLV
jgi:hypothetical protein